MRRGGWLLLWVAGCEQPLPARPDPPAAPVASRVHAPPERRPGAPPAPGPGGFWTGCYAHFRPGASPGRDAERLGQQCGAAGGLRPAAPLREGRLEEGQEQEHSFQAERGQCLRVFGVSEPGLRDLDLAVLDPRGRLLASDGIDDRWPIVPPDGTLCLMEGGEFRLRVRARKGAGAYAAQPWLLP